jgi:hypothetical protein
MKLTFDPPESGWTCNGSASIVEDPAAPSPPNALRLAWGIGSDPRAYRTLSGLTVGESYDVWARCNFDGIDTPGLVFVRLIYNEGGGASLDAYLNKNPLVTGWELRYVGTLLYDAADQRFQIVGTHRVGFLGLALIDTIYIGESPEVIEEARAMAAKWNAVSAASDVLKSINGDNFHTNLNDRVYSKFETPNTEPDRELPWGILQQIEPTTYEHRETPGHRVWRMVGWFFFGENAESDPMNTSAAKACHDFEDDVWEAFEIDPTLGGACKNCSIIAVKPSYGVTTDYAEVEVLLEFEQWIGRGELRPS